MKGGDYCYFKYPYQSSYDELYNCLREQGIDNKYLSSYCEQKYHYKRQMKISFPEREYFDCLNQKAYGIDFDTTNQCANLLLMPANQDFIVKQMDVKSITGYQISNNIETNVPDFKYTEQPLNLMTSDQVIFLGSLSSFLQGEYASKVWVLEHEFTKLINNRGKTRQNITESYGNLLYKKSDFMSWIQLKNESERLSIENYKEYNPTAEDDEITIQSYDNVDEEAVDAAAAAASEELTSGLGLF